MSKTLKYAFFILSAIMLAVVASMFIYSDKIAVLNPKGIIAFKERNLIIISTLLMLTVVIPVLIMTVLFAWEYRSSNLKAKYAPNWDYSFLAEAIWWGVPFVIVTFISILTWYSSHHLDPFRPLESDKKPIRIQVVALQWKWLFIYPEYNIATLNFFHFPEQTPVAFEITADAPMNSFWIPQLSGQMYAMPGMKTQLHIMANEPGNFKGLPANLSGKGFAWMTFNAIADSEEHFNQWIEQAKHSSNHLNLDTYNQLVKPSENNPLLSFLLKEEDLFEQIIMKYMMPIK